MKGPAVRVVAWFMGVLCTLATIGCSIAALWLDHGWRFLGTAVVTFLLGLVFAGLFMNDDSRGGMP